MTDDEFRRLEEQARTYETAAAWSLFVVSQLALAETRGGHAGVLELNADDACPYAETGSTPDGVDAYEQRRAWLAGYALGRHRRDVARMSVICP
jgi:hypothetical protein